MSSSTITFFWRNSPQWARASSFTRFLDHTQRCTTVSRTPLDEVSARRRNLYLTLHNIHNRQRSMPPVRFEPTISARERPQTFALDGAATGTGTIILCTVNVRVEYINKDAVLVWMVVILRQSLGLEDHLFTLNPHLNSLACN